MQALLHDPWALAVTVALLIFTLAVFVYGEIQVRKARKRYAFPVDEPASAPAPVDSPFAIPAASVEEIHRRYEGLAQTDPRLAGRLKYRDMLSLHGR